MSEPENRVGSKRDRSGEIVAHRNQHLAAAQNRAPVETLLDGSGVLGCAVALGADLSLVQVFQISPLLLLVQVLPVSFGGWGAREAVAVVLFSLVGLSASTALARRQAMGLDSVLSPQSPICTDCKS